MTSIEFAGFDLTDGTNYPITLGSEALASSLITELRLPAVDSICNYAVYLANVSSVILDGYMIPEREGTQGFVFGANSDNKEVTIYYPYAYCPLNMSEADPSEAEYFYTVERMRNLGYYNTWIPYTVDENGLMVPDDSLQYCPNWGDWDNPFLENTTAEAANSAETVPTGTEPEHLPSLTTVALPTAAAANVFRVSGSGASVRTLSSRQNSSGMPGMTPSLTALYGGEYSTDVTENRTVKTASFSGLVPGEEYLLLALTTLDAADPLHINNLIHIDQGTASAEGTLSFDYVERQKFSASYVMVSGPSNRNLKDATVVVPRVYASDSEQVIQPTVIFDGKILTEGEDYILSGQVAFSAAGTYTCYIRGIYAYTGTLRCDYTVEESPYAPAPMPPTEPLPLEQFALSQDYLLLETYGTAQLAVDVQPAELAEAKSAVSGTLKATGNLDVIRDGTALTVTPAWKNCNDADRTEELKIFCGEEDVTAQFHIQQEDGKYILSRAGGLNHSGKYTAVLAATFANGTTAKVSGALKLKMGSAKLTVNTGGTSLFANDRNSRINVSFGSSDSTLNKVARAELDPKLADQFELIDYGNVQYAIGFRNGKVPGKLTTANISLNVWLKGNETAKANASVKVKISIIR